MSSTILLVPKKTHCLERLNLSLPQTWISSTLQTEQSNAIMAAAPVKMLIADKIQRVKNSTPGCRQRSRMSKDSMILFFTFSKAIQTSPSHNFSFLSRYVPNTLNWPRCLIWLLYLLNHFNKILTNLLSQGQWSWFIGTKAGLSLQCMNQMGTAALQALLHHRRATQNKVPAWQITQGCCSDMVICRHHLWSHYYFFILVIPMSSTNT